MYFVTMLQYSFSRALQEKLWHTVKQNVLIIEEINNTRNFIFQQYTHLQ